MLFARLLRPFMTIGTLRIVDAGGLCTQFGVLIPDLM